MAAEPTTIRDMIDAATEMRLTGMRQGARHKLEQWQKEVDDLERELEIARRQVLAAKEDVAYWDSIREPLEMLHECGFEGPFEVVTSGFDFVRDGVTLRRCNRTHPCPDHGRPLGGSDWRLHSTKDVFAREDFLRGTPVTYPVPETGWPHTGCADHQAFALKTCPRCIPIHNATVTGRDHVTEGDAQSTGHPSSQIGSAAGNAHGEFASGAHPVRIDDLPTPTEGL